MREPESNQVGPEEESPAHVARAVRALARELGFDAVGIAPVLPSEQSDAYRAWVEAGYAGEMGYLSRADAVEKRGDPSRVVEGARSAVVVAANYYTADTAREAPGGVPDRSRAIFARYALNDDYHELLKPRLIRLQEGIAALVGPMRGRAYVDTGPVLERELARRAGLGWQGSNTMLILPRRGSYAFLGVVLVDVELPSDEPFARDHCGSCSRCLDGCPTGALLGRDASGAPVMDARRCISYLTIELKGPLPRELRPLLGNRIYGCDICQEVCPHNNPRFVQITSEEAFWPRQGVHGAKLVELMSLTQEEFSTRFKNSPVKRAKRRGLLRNVAVALGNWGSPEAVPVLADALSDDEPLVRGHAAWALGRIATGEAVQALRGRIEEETDEWVRKELGMGLEEALASSPNTISFGIPVADSR